LNRVGTKGSIDPGFILHTYVLGACARSQVGRELTFYFTFFHEGIPLQLLSVSTLCRIKYTLEIFTNGS